MATVNGTISMVRIVDGGATSAVKIAEVLFTATGTYDQAATAPIEILLVDDAIEDSVRNGKTVTLLDCGSGPAGLIGSDEYHCSSTVINSSAVECDLYKTSTNTEHAGAALSTFYRPCSVFVAYKES
jgi:hypothetical protein